MYRDKLIYVAASGNRDKLEKILKKLSEENRDCTFVIPELLFSAFLGKTEYWSDLVNCCLRLLDLSDEFWINQTAKGKLLRAEKNYCEKYKIVTKEL